MLITPVRNEPPTEHASQSGPASHCLLWVDGIGGYLVCLGNRVTLGQASPDAVVDIPIFADISRHHATLSRDAEGYLLEALRPVQVNGQKVEKALLQSGDRLTLGASCQFVFRQPVPVSASARLDLASGHRLRLSVDAILLMADTLVLGPDSQVHVSVPDLKQPLYLFRQKEGLGVRYAGNLTMGGQTFKERANVVPGVPVVSDDCSLAVELLSGGES